ncbi:uncharacterized protein LOC132938697 [Metopolophium dirhodum]|uniref:uncharacterized protein LOC132938697 n=1 Tax=Metopolophium dirhodum TaxID=44670 RepID=UPI00298F9714|nr:uncharacterized protein LOC132938697 [Metopolophium dirhodum]
MINSDSEDDEVKKSNEKKLTISTDLGWSPLKRSVVESSYAHITSTPVNQTTNQFISDIKSLNSKSKYYHNDNGNSVPLKDDVIVQTNHSINTPFTTKTTVSPQNTVDNYNSCLNSNIIAKGDSPHLSFAKRSLFSDLDKSQNPGIIDSPIKISKRTLSENNCSMVYNLMNSPSTSNEQTVQKVDNCVIIKTTESKSLNSKQQKSLHKDDQYAKLLNLMVTIKYELRSMQEKLDIMIQRDEETNLTKTKDLSIYDTGDIDNKLPIKTQEQLEEIENDLSKNKHYRCQMIKRLSSVGGKSIKIMAKRIMAILFILEILCEFSYSGRGNKKLPFEKLLLNKIIFDSVLTIKKFANADNAANEIDQVIKYVLIQTSFKIKDKAGK